MALQKFDETIQAYQDMFPKCATQLPVHTARQFLIELLQQQPDLVEPHISVGQIPHPYINFDWINNQYALSFMHDGSAIWMHRNQLVKQPWHPEFAAQVLQTLHNHQIHS